MTRYKIADTVFEFNNKFRFTDELCKRYAYSGGDPTEFTVNVTDEDIEKEQNYEEPKPKEYLESVAVYRKICEYVFAHKDGMLFHCSAVVYNGEAFLFSAPSGTGKSTHAALWLEILGDKAFVINDDKPIVRKIGEDFYVYGTPWSGKHMLDVNAKAKIKAICFLSQAKENAIRKASAIEIFPLVLNQTVRFDSEEETDKSFKLIDKLLASSDLYKLACLPNESAAKLAFETMTGG